MVLRRSLSITAALLAALLVPFSSQAQIRSQSVVSGVTQPVAFVQDPSLPDVFYIVEKMGRVRTVRNGALLPTDFADLRPLVSAVSEQGLLGMAFAPDAAETGRVFFSYTDLNGRSVVSRYKRVISAAPQIDTTSRLDLQWSTGERFILPPTGAHLGGHLAFGADGYLYIAKGDAGNSLLAQDQNTLVGKMLRVDVNVPDSDSNGMRVPPDNPFLDGLPAAALPEIWAFGLRNPWRYNFDNIGPGATGALLVADVGAAAREEINYEPRNAGGRNYGWPHREGLLAAFLGTPAYLPLTDPIFDYGRSEGTSVTGGFVYRGRLLGSSYLGRYFYADFIAGRVWSLGLNIDATGAATVAGCGSPSGCDVREHTAELAPLGNISSFGRDAAGELYVVIYGGQVRKIVGVDTTTPGTIADIADQQVNEDTATAPINFTVNDVDDPSSQWVVTAISSDTALIPNANLILSGSGSNRSIRVTPAPNRFGTAFVTVTFSSNASRPGAAVSDTFVVTVNPVNDPPSISDVPNTTTSEDVAAGPITIVVNDLETVATSLTVSATSSNQTLVPNAAILLAGSGGTRTLTISPAANQSGTATITVTVSDGSTTSSDTFVVSITPVNDPPTISSLPNQLVGPGTTMLGPLSILVGDVETAAASLSLTAGSSNQAVVTNSGITLGGSGANRTLSLAMGPGVSGTAVITVTVSDGSAQTSTVFAVTVSDPIAPPPPPPPPPPPAPTVPGPPRNVAVDVPDGRTIVARWDAPAAAVSGYRIELGTSSGASDAGIFTTGVTATFTIGNLSAGQYFLRVRATSDAGISEPSNEIAVTLDGSSLSPRSPRNLRAMVQGATVRLMWDPPSDRSGLTAYVVEAGSAPGLANYGQATVANLEVTIPVLPDATYYVRVRALDATGRAATSNEIAVIVGGTSTLCLSPTAPRALVGQAIGTVMQLFWSAPSAGNAPTRYLIHAGSTSGASDIAIVPLDGSFTSAGGSVPDGTYFVRVMAINACGVSEPSNEVAVTIGGPPPPAPGAPGNLFGQVSGRQVTLTWEAPVVGGPAARYIIEVADAAGNPLASFDTGNPALSFSQGNVPPGAYVVRVRAANRGGVGPASVPVTVVVP